MVATHLLSVLSHRLGLTLWQPAVADKINEIPVLEDVWRGLVVEGRGTARVRTDSVG